METSTCVLGNATDCPCQPRDVTTDLRDVSHALDDCFAAISDKVTSLPEGSRSIAYTALSLHCALLAGLAPAQSDGFDLVARTKGGRLATYLEGVLS